MAPFQSLNISAKRGASICCCKEAGFGHDGRYLLSGTVYSWSHRDCKSLFNFYLCSKRQLCAIPVQIFGERNEEFSFYCALQRTGAIFWIVTLSREIRRQLVSYVQRDAYV